MNISLTALQSSGVISVLTSNKMSIHNMQDCLNAAAYCEARAKDKMEYPLNVKEWNKYADMYFRRAMQLDEDARND